MLTSPTSLVERSAPAPTSPDAGLRAPATAPVEGGGSTAPAPVNPVVGSPDTAPTPQPPEEAGRSLVERFSAAFELNVRVRIHASSGDVEVERRDEAERERPLFRFAARVRLELRDFAIGQNAPTGLRDELAHEARDMRRGLREASRGRDRLEAIAERYESPEELIEALRGVFDGFLERLSGVLGVSVPDADDDAEASEPEAELAAAATPAEDAAAPLATSAAAAELAARDEEDDDAELVVQPADEEPDTTPKDPFRALFGNLFGLFGGLVERFAAPASGSGFTALTMRARFEARYAFAGAIGAQAEPSASPSGQAPASSTAVESLETSA